MQPSQPSFYPQGLPVAPMISGLSSLAPPQFSWDRPPKGLPLPRYVELTVLEPITDDEIRQFCFTVDAEMTIQQFKQQFRGGWGQLPSTEFYFATSAKDKHRSLNEQVTFDQLSQAGPCAKLYIIRGKPPKHEKQACCIF